MATQGPLYPATVTTEAGPSGDNDWLTPANIGADDGAVAEITAATFDNLDHSYRLKAQNFGFTIPTGATIDGIVVEIDRNAPAGGAQDNEVRLYDAAGALVGDNKATATAWPAALTVATYGSATDLWTASPTVAMVNDPDFGVALIAAVTANNTDIGVDFIRVTVHYTPDPNVTVTPTTRALTLTTFAPTVRSGVPVNGVTVALVVGNDAALTAGDIVIRDRLDLTLGYTVFIVDDAAAADTTRNFVAIAESCLAATVAAKYKNVTMPVVVFEPGITDDMDMASVSAATGAAEDNVVILDAAHGMAAGLSGTVLVQSPAARIDYNLASELAASAQQVYRTEASTTQIVGYAYESGATMQNAHVAEARRAYCGLAPDAVVTTLNANGLALLDAAIEWVAPATSVTVTPTTAALTLATFAPTVSTPQTLTPGVASLTTATFAPTVAVSNNQSVTPTTASLTTATFAPTVSTTANQTVTPTTAALVTSRFAPTVTATAHQTVTPTTASLATSLFAPTVTASDHKSVTPTTAALVTATFAPTVNVAANQTVTPTTAVLTTATFAPTVSTTAHQTVTPTTASLTLTAFAPTVTGGAGLTVTPGIASLTLAAFAPSVTASDHKSVTPTTTALTLTAFAPVVTVGASVTVTPGVAALSLTAFAPNVVLSDHKVVTPDLATLLATTYAPTVTASAHIAVTPTTAALVLATFAPEVSNGTVLGGLPPIAYARRLAMRAFASNQTPGGRASHPGPTGNASNPKPE